LRISTDLCWLICWTKQPDQSSRLEPVKCLPIPLQLPLFNKEFTALSSYDESLIFGTPHLVELTFSDDLAINPSDHSQIASKLFSKAEELLNRAGQGSGPQINSEDPISLFSPVSLNLCRANLIHILSKTLAYSSELMDEATATQVAQEIIDHAME
jgi:hypothetical protein